MKKILTTICLGLLIGAAIPVSASADDQTTSRVGITFYQSSDKVIPMNKIVVSDNLDKISSRKDNRLLPKTSEEQNRFIGIIGTSFLLIVALFYSLKRRIVMEKKNEK